jgi:hypothetical protein
MSENLSDFFNLIAEAKSENKKLKEEEDKFISELIDANGFVDEILHELTGKEYGEQQEFVDNIIEEVEEEVKDINDVVRNIISSEPQQDTRKYIKEGLLNIPSNEKNTDPLTPLDQKFATLEDLEKHYKLFLNRIQQQLSTLGGGGETRLRYLDDVVGVATNSGAYDGKVLSWNSSENKAEFVSVDSLDTDTLDIVTTRGNTTTNGIGVSFVNLPLGSVISADSAIVANITAQLLSSVLEYGDSAAIGIGSYGLTYGITGVPYAVYELIDVPSPALEVDDIIGGAAIPVESRIIGIGTGVWDKVIITDKNFAVGAALPEPNTRITFARPIVNAGVSIATTTSTDITLNPGADGNVITHSDIIPYVTNVWSLGSPARRFKEIWFGTGTIYVQDEVLGNDQALGARDGNFYIDGGAGLEVGEWVLLDNTIYIADDTRDVYIGTLGSTGDVVFNRAISVETTEGRESFRVGRRGLTTIKTPDTILTTQSALNIVGSSSGNQYPRNFTGTLLQMTAQDGQSARLSLDTFGNGENTYALIAGRAARGTVDSPSATQSGDTIFRISVQGYGETDFVSSIGRISIRAKEDFTDTAAGTEVVFQTTGIGSTTIVTSAKIDDSGLVLTGTANTESGITFRDGSRLTYFPPIDDVDGPRHLATDGDTIFWGAIAEGAIIFKGTWDATNPPGGGTPTISDATGELGWQWIVGNGGTQDLGSGNITFNSGDLVIHDGSKYVNIPANVAQVQSNWTETNPSVPAFIQNKPSLFSGDYNDLTNKPSIPAAQIQSDWNQTDTNSKDYIKNKPTISPPGFFTSTTTTQASTLTVDFTGPSVIFWQPSANGNRAVTLTNFAAGRSVKIFITPHGGADNFTFTGVTASQCSDKSITYELGGGGAGQASMMIELFSTTTNIGGVWLFAYGGVKP